MPLLTRPDGVALHWEVRGEGPLVVVCPISYFGSVQIEGFIAGMARDHAVLTYDVRGTGRSSRSGPYDAETDVADLAALLEDVGPARVGVGTADGTGRLIRLAAWRPDLLESVVVSGTQALSRAPAHGLAGSRAVLDALVTLMENDYRAGLRAAIERTDSDVSESELRARIDAAERHCPQEAWVGRLRAWIADDLSEPSAALGERLWILHHGTNPWFGGDVADQRGALPDAGFVEVSDGLRDAAPENAAIVRQVVQTLRASSG
jgi:pimeloyl-ACP methyl ester carboxylesterase